MTALTAPARRTPTPVVVTLIAVAAALLMAIGVSTASATRARGASPGSASSTTVHVIEHAVTDTVVHSGGGADVTGNTLTFHNQVFNAADRKQVGHDQGFCMRIDPTEGSYECMWTTFLAHGQITVEGPYYDHKNSVLAITGGTGAYQRVRGEMDLKARHGGAEYDFIFHLAG